MGPRVRRVSGGRAGRTFRLQSCPQRAGRPEGCPGPRVSRVWMRIPAGSNGIAHRAAPAREDRVII